ncbi:energy transducer TonB [Tenacibaculum aestuariivivum]|uniref:energy transducer TonB n=1 Tax=Tenacibaculum aestuariivivum TaxID=2006131 RepID=UPI003AB6D3C1
MNNILIFITLFSVSQVFCQETCITKVIIDYNTVNKCLINKSNIVKDSVLTQSNILTYRRYFKKRSHLNPIVYSVSNLKTNDILKIKPINRVNTSLLALLKKKVKKKYVSFDTVDEIPVFTSCKSDFSNKIDCFNLAMKKHILTHFKYPLRAIKHGVEGSLEVSFVIDVNGYITNIQVIESHIFNSNILVNEVFRVFSLLPKFIPGKHNRSPVNVLYKLPVNFTLNNT